MKTLIHGGLKQSSAPQLAIGMTVKTSLVVETLLSFRRGIAVNEVHEAHEAHKLTHPFVDVIVLQLNEASADGSDVALLIGEGHAAGSLWVFELWVRVNASIANTSVQPVHDHSQLHCGERKGREVGVGREMISATNSSREFL